MFVQEIKEAIAKQVKGEITLEVPPSPDLGDFAFPCFLLAKEWKKAPPQIAAELAKKIEAPEFVEKIENHGPYVNFFLAKNIGKVILPAISSTKDKYGSSEGDGTIIAIDLSSPNIGKPFHFGHLRSTIIGESIARLLEFTGNKVERLNYLGDWGTTFGKLMYAYSEWGDENELKKNPVYYLLELYVKFNEKAKEDESLNAKGREWFAKLEQGDEKAKELWGLFRAHSLEEFNRVYDMLGSKFDSFNGEAYYSRQAPEAIDIVRKKGVTEVHDEALIVRLEGHEMPLMLRKADGSTTYASRDVATLLDRIHTLKAQKVLYVVDHGQSLHFDQLFQLADMLGHPKENFKHVTFGLYLSPDGGKLSTRAGKVVFMVDVLNEAIELATKTIEEKNPTLKNKEEVAKQVGVAALKFGDLMNDRQKDVTFDLKRFTSFEGDTGPYLMYTHARAASILRKTEVKPADASLLVDDTEQKLLKVLMTFPDRVQEAARSYKPHVISQYLLEVAHAFNEFYHKCKVLGEEKEDVRLARVMLVESMRQVLQNGLGLLGIAAPSEM